MLRSFQFNLRKPLSGVGIALVAVLVHLLPANAWALANLKKVQITESDRIDLLFDTKIIPGQIKTEFVGENIQLSMSGVSVYPAKINTLSGDNLTKIFAYQYSPSLVRCRFTVKGNAADYQDRVVVKILGKIVSFQILPSNKPVASAPVIKESSSAIDAPARASRLQKLQAIADRASAPAKTVVTEATSEAAMASNSQGFSVDEKRLLDRVTSSASSSDREPKTNGHIGNGVSSSITHPLTSGKPLPSPMRPIGMLLFVVGLFGAFAMGLKKIKGMKEPKGIAGFLGKLGGGSANKKIIEILATHHLAPKKSIVMVKIQGRTLVLGMTNDHVNLITEFRSGDEGDESMDVNDFAEGLKRFEDGPIASRKSATPKKDVFGPMLGAILGTQSGGYSPPPPNTRLTKAPAAPRPTELPSSSSAYLAPQQRSASQAYATAGAASPVDALLDQGPAFTEVVKSESTKTSLRAQIKSRTEGMKEL